MNVPAPILFLPANPHRLLPVLVLLSSLAILLSGCANPGPPHPPSLHLPAVVTDLTAERTGDTVRLHWTTPTKTTDGLLVTDPVTAQLCRVLPPVQASSGKAAPAPCSPVQRAPVTPGSSEMIDPLPPALSTGPATLIEYRIELRNARERSAGESTPAFAAAGQAPLPVANLRIEPAEQGALLQWTPEDAVDMIELDRRSLARPPAQKPARQAGKPSLQPIATEPEVSHLRASGQTTTNTPFRPDAGGTIDATAHRGESYVYTAQRTRQVVLDGHTLEIHSAPSVAVTVLMRDTFPPYPPTGLEAIAGTAGTAATPSLPAIDLSWTPNTEPDLAGYLIYRQEGAGRSVRLTPAAILEPGFRDVTPAAGHLYTYTVTAIDASGNESTPSHPAQEEVRLP